MKAVSIDNLNQAFRELNAEALGIMPRPVIAAAMRNKADDKTHKEVVNQIVGWLAQEPRCVIASVNRQDRKSTALTGLPDIICAHAGIATAFEVKVGADKLSADQERVIAQMRANGWRVTVVHSLDETIQEWEESK